MVARKRDFQRPKCPFEILSSSPTLSYIPLPKRVNLFITQKPLRVLKLLWIFIDSVVYRFHGDSVLFRFFIDRIIFRVLSDRVFFESSAIESSSGSAAIDSSLGSSMLFFIFLSNRATIFFIKNRCFALHLLH